MKSIFLITASGLALAGLAACAPSQPPAARAALDCPQVQGDLTRASQAADGKTCVYRTSGGEEVTLALVSTGGDPRATLGAIEAQLVGSLKDAKTAAEAAGETATDATAQAPTAQAPTAQAEAAAAASQDAAKAAEDAAKDAAQAAADTGNNVNVRLPGLHVEASDGKTGETARISLPGVRIIADDATDSADIRVGGMHIQAHDKEATIRMWKDVRLKGEALSREKRGVRATFIYTGEQLPDGYQMVGYEAGGPKAGPITVATVRTKNAENLNIGDNAVYKDVQRLVRRNGGV